MFKKANRINSLESVNIYHGNAGGFPTFTKHLPQKMMVLATGCKHNISKSVFLASAAVCLLWESECTLDGTFRLRGGANANCWGQWDIWNSNVFHCRGWMAPNELSSLQQMETEVTYFIFDWVPVSHQTVFLSSSSRFHFMCFRIFRVPDSEKNIRCFYPCLV